MAQFSLSRKASIFNLRKRPCKIIDLASIAVLYLNRSKMICKSGKNEKE
jgi:hypothetical protein